MPCTAPGTVRVMVPVCPPFLRPVFTEMVTVFGAFMLSDQVLLKVIGLGMAAAGLLDATVVRTVLVPSTMELLIQRAEFVPGEGVPLFELRPPVFEGLAYVAKRGFDLVVAGLALVALSPLLAAIALLVKATSRGPVLHRGVRPGVGERPFACLKFRTMYENAETTQPELEHRNEKQGAIFKIRDDPRLTPVGRVLRRFSLDELPNLVNVLRGDMAMVGPRPTIQEQVDRYTERQRRRLEVKPGITGWAQVNGRVSLPWPERIELDVWYVENRSALVDLRILLRTPLALFGGTYKGETGGWR